MWVDISLTTRSWTLNLGLQSHPKGDQTSILWTTMRAWSTVEFLNIFGHKKNCCNYPKILKRWLYLRVMHPKDAHGMANSVEPDPDSTLFAQAYFVQQPRIIMVNTMRPLPVLMCCDLLPFCTYAGVWNWFSGRVLYTFSLVKSISCGIFSVDIHSRIY